MGFIENDVGGGGGGWGGEKSFGGGEGFGVKEASLVVESHLDRFSFRPPFPSKPEVPEDNAGSGAGAMVVDLTNIGGGRAFLLLVSTSRGDAERSIDEEARGEWEGGRRESCL